MNDEQPDFIARVVKEIAGKDKWTDVGVAYKDARGLIAI